MWPDSLPSPHQRASRSIASLYCSRSWRTHAPQNTPSTAQPLSRTRLSGSFGISPAAKPTTRWRPSQPSERGGAIEVEIGGNFDDVVRRYRRAFTRGVEIGVAHDAVAAREGSDAGADALDHAGKLAAGRERKRRLGLILAGDDEGVEEVQSDRDDLGDDLARCWRGVGNVAEHEVVGGAEALAENGFHGRTAGTERRRPHYIPARAGTTILRCKFGMRSLASRSAFTLPNSRAFHAFSQFAVTEIW